MDKKTRFGGQLLLIVHIGLIIWGGMGFIEYFIPSTNFQLQNPNFPGGMQFLHWLAISTGGIIFLVNYSIKWHFAFLSQTVAYTIMASLCSVQTLDLLVNDLKYISMMGEFVVYILILVFLYRTDFFQLKFEKTNK